MICCDDRISPENQKSLRRLLLCVKIARRDSDRKFAQAIGITENIIFNFLVRMKTVPSAVIHQIIDFMERNSVRTNRAPTSEDIHDLGMFWLDTSSHTAWIIHDAEEATRWRTLDDLIEWYDENRILTETSDKCFIDGDDFISPENQKEVRWRLFCIMKTRPSRGQELAQEIGISEKTLFNFLINRKKVSWGLLLKMVTFLAQNRVFTGRAPTSEDMHKLGRLWIDTSSQTTYIADTIVKGATQWLKLDELIEWYCETGKLEKDIL